MKNIDSDLGDRDRAIDAMQNNIRIVEAISYFRRSLGRQDAAGLPADHVNRTFPTTGLASVYYRTGRYDEAEPLFREMLPIRVSGFGEAHRLTSEIKSDLAAVLIATGDCAEAETPLLDAHTRLMDDRGADDPRSQRSARRLAELYEARGDPGRAAQYREMYQGEFQP